MYGPRYGYGYTFAPASFTDPGNHSHDKDANDYYLVQIQDPTPTSSNQVSVTEWNQTTTGGYTDYIWFYCGTDGTYSMTALYFNADSAIAPSGRVGSDGGNLVFYQIQGVQAMGEYHHW